MIGWEGSCLGDQGKAEKQIPTSTFVLCSVVRDAIPCVCIP